MVKWMNSMSINFTGIRISRHDDTWREKKKVCVHLTHTVQWYDSLCQNMIDNQGNLISLNPAIITVSSPSYTTHKWYIPFNEKRMRTALMSHLYYRSVYNRMPHLDIRACTRTNIIAENDNWMKTIVMHCQNNRKENIPR